MVQLSQKKEGGLAGIVAGDSSICLCDPIQESLLYRGYSIQDLAKSASFEEVAWLLIHHELPSPSELDCFKKELRRFRTLSPMLKKLMEEMPPTTSLMAAARSAVSLLGHIDPEQQESDPFIVAERTIGALPSLLLYWYHFHANQKKIDLDNNEDSFAGFILKLIKGTTPSTAEIHAMNVSLILYAEHEFNASTFTVRTIASTLSDYYSAICGGIGALAGPLHGGANEAALSLITSFSSPEKAEEALLEMLKRKELIMGFGHRVYTTNDPRSDLIYKEAKKLAQTENHQNLLAIAERIEQVMRREKGLFPNLDFYSALTYHFLGIPSYFYTPLFVFSRLAGWSAHYLEQKQHNKLIRPISNYIGPQMRSWTPLDARKR